MLRIRTIRTSIQQRHQGVVWVVFSLGLFVVGDLIFGNPSNSPDGAGHALAHISTGVPLLLLALVVYRLSRPRNPIMRVARALFVMFALVFSVGQFEHSVGVYTGDPPHIVGKLTSSQIAVIGLGILLAIANMVKAGRSRNKHAPS